MNISDVCKLMTQNPDAHGVHSTGTVTKRQVFCTVQSVTRAEYFAAANAGLKPEYILKLADMAEYADERAVEFRGKTYSVVRTYITPDGGIELTIERADIK